MFKSIKKSIEDNKNLTHEERVIKGYMKMFKITEEEATEMLKKDFKKMGKENQLEYKQKRATGVLCCPKCLGENISSNKKGFGTGKAAAGLFAGGAIGGLLAGGIGSNKVLSNCLDCGHKFNPKFK